MKISAVPSSMIKIFTLTFGLFLTSSVSAQIVSGNNPNPETEKQEKKKREKREWDRDSLSGTTYYLTGLYNYSYRSFEDRSVFGSYATWEDQTPGHTGGFNFGVLMPLNPSLQLDLGIGYFGHKENYAYDHPTSDSTYQYSNNYMQLAIPLRLRYVVGNKFQFFAFGGMTGINLLNIRFNESYTTNSGLSVISETELIKEKLSIFNVMASAGAGITYNLDWVGFTLFPEFRYHLINSYDPKSKPIDHKMWGVGLNAGLTLRF